jgi:thiol-disulfide isomerase/thioredoxin
MNFLKSANKKFLIFLLFIIYGCSEPEYYLFDGREGRLEDFNGKWLIINYWADWCPPCIKEMPELSAFYESNKDEVLVLAFNFDELEGSELKEQILRFKVEIPSLLTNPKELYGWQPPEILPATYIIGPQGTLRESVIGPQTQDSLEKLLEKNKRL